VKLIFIGTSAFARPTLAALARRHHVLLVVTQPPLPAGRHGRLQTPPVEEEAKALDLPVYQPERINRQEAVAKLRSVPADAFVVASYGQLLKPVVFAQPPSGTINLHASLLPAYRGAAPIQWAIIRGETTTGITTFLIDQGMDTGDILLQRSVPIDPDETAGELEARLAQRGAEVILDTLDGLQRSTLSPIPQPGNGVSLAPLLSRDDGRIKWSSPAPKIHNLVRGTNPWPGASTDLGKERVKIHRTRLTGINSGPIAPGHIGLRETGRLLVGTEDWMLEILEIQRPGRPRISGREFLNGLRGSAAFT